MKKIIWTTLLLAGCSSVEVDNGIEPLLSDRISFSTGIAYAITSRSPIVSDENGRVTADVVGVQILREDNNIPSTSFTSGVIPPSRTTATILHNDNPGAVGNLMSLEEKQYFDANHTTPNFMAYYPAPNNGFASGVAKYKIDGSQDIITSGLESAVYSDNNTVNFSFDHQLALINLVIDVKNAGEAAFFGNLIKASIKVPTELDLQIVNQEFQLGKSLSPAEDELPFFPGNSVTLQAGENKIGMLMVYPEKFNKIKLGFANLGEKEYDLAWALLNGKTDLVPGGEYTITISLNAFEIQFDVSVQPWGQGNGGGEDEEIGGDGT